MTLSHLLYVDDVFVFGKASISNLFVIFDTLYDFARMSGLCINLQKSNLILPLSKDFNVRRSLAIHSSLKTTHSFEKYLGINISPNKLKISDYFDLVDKTKDKIRG